MTSPGIPPPLLSEQYSASHYSQRSSVAGTATTALRHVYRRHRPRTRRAKVLWVAVVSVFVFFFATLRSSSDYNNRVGLRLKDEQTPSYWTKYPSYHPFPERPEDSPILSTVKKSASPGPESNENDTKVPSNLQKTNPSFHVLVTGIRRRNPGICRTVASAMILNYPPPTLIRYGKELPVGSSENDYMVDKVAGIYNYLTYNPSHVREHDFVLIVDGGFDTFFQLPPEVLIGRFQGLVRENNLRLQRRYGFAALERRFKQKGDHPMDKDMEMEMEMMVQKYSQRVLFGASKTCFPNLTEDAGCVTVPQPSLPPDIYGWKTDVHPAGHLNRPRWLNPDVVIGQAADLKLIYGQVLQFVEQRRNHNKNNRADYLALTKLYGRQEYVRELERRRTSNRVKEWLYKQIGISAASNITGINIPLEHGKRYEYGIGLDFESRLFFNMLHSKNDVEWFEYDNITKSSRVQAEHGVPRERRLLLPTDLTTENNNNIDNNNNNNPFTQPTPLPGEPVKPPYNTTLDALPTPQEKGWHNLPLMTNIHSASVPALIHLNGDQSLRDRWWSNMWFAPWTRALLRKYIRSSRGHAIARSSLLGGQDWWDSRGGTGGVWTDNGEWIDFGDLCAGFEGDVFGDGLGGWGVEGKGGGEGGLPVYNQWGRLVKGKEP